MRRDLRRATEFILRVKGCYSESDVLRKDYMTFFRLLDEAEEEERSNIERIEKANKNA